MSDEVIQQFVERASRSIRKAKAAKAGGEDRLLREHLAHQQYRISTHVNCGHVKPKKQIGQGIVMGGSKA